MEDIIKQTEEAVAKNTAENTPEDTEYRLGICPYYIRDRGKGVVYCECAKFRFPDKQARRDIVYGYCAHPEGYKRCALKQMMDSYYERKYERIKTQERMEIINEADKKQSECTAG